MHAHLPLDGSVALSDWGVIRATGADAAAFLQGQLTNDVLTLDATHARLAGFCSAKGRLQASFIVVKSEAETLLLMCAADLLAPTLKRLSMFVMRAKCRLTDATAELPLFGALGVEAEAIGAGIDAWRVRAADGAVVVRLPDVDGPRALRIGGATPPSSGAGAVTLADWRALDVRSGIVTIEAATVDRFVPQMLNFEVVGGVDFAKGCYPGQEVVARSQYRGTLKRRTMLFACDRLPRPGEDVFHSADPSQPSGMVASAAPAGVGGVALVEVKLALLDSGAWHLGTSDGPLMIREPLPYALPVAEEASAL